MAIDISTAVKEVRDNFDMLIERHPEMREALEARITEIYGEILGGINAMIALGEERITQEECDAIMAERAERDLARRIEMWGTTGPWQVECQDCGESFVHDAPEPPSMYPQCEDYCARR